jgi:hypothetical protein
MSTNTNPYETPIGSFTDWASAAEALEAADLDPIACIKYTGPRAVTMYKVGQHSRPQMFSAFDLETADKTEFGGGFAYRLRGDDGLLAWYFASNEGAR